jgi:hypothetical protein
MANNRHYFVYGNSAQGFVNKLSSNIQGIDRLFIIRGRPGTGKACVMQTLAEECEKTGFSLEYLHCPTAPGTYDGIIIPGKKLAVIDGTDLHYTKRITSDPEARYIDTDTLFDRKKLSQTDDTITSVIYSIGNCHERAFSSFRAALKVHDEWEKIYIENMDFLKADALASDTIALLLAGHGFDKTPVVKERFFGASTPTGAMDYIENLTGNISKRYLLKGRPGTGKSTLVRRLAAASSERGLDMELYSCAFDSNSLDAILWPELDVCLFDSTAPHLYEPSRPGDEVIDMYAACVTPGTDERYEKELADITFRYRKAVQDGTAHLSQAGGQLDALTAVYTELADPREIDRITADFAGQLQE